MRLEEYYLKPNIVAEPLVNQWYAWPYLISPASAAMIMANLQAPLMKSFISAPQVHANAARNRALLGGKFIGYSANRVQEIKALMDKTLSEQAHMYRLADGIKRLDNLLVSDANGGALEDFYAKVPVELKGYVELVYDLNNQPSIRFIEGLLYRSKFYDTSRQGFHLYEIEADDRPFSLSTPRLEGQNGMCIDIPFSSPAVDEFFAMKTKPGSVREIKNKLGVTVQHGDTFDRFFTKNPPSAPSIYEGEKVRVRYYGHASVLLEVAGISVMIDPVLSYTYPNGLSRYTYEDLPEKIDYVLLSHNHQDHVLLETLLQMRHKIGQIVVPRNGGGSLQDISLRLALKNIGFDNVVELSELDSLEIPGGEIVGLPFFGEHSDIDIQSKLAFFVRMAGRSFLFAADSCNLAPELYRHLHAEFGDIDVLFIGMECDGAPMSWLYAPFLTRPISRAMDQARRLNGSDGDAALGVVEALKAKQAYVYAMGQEPWTNYIMSVEYTDESRPITESDKFVQKCRERGIKSDRLYAKMEMLV